MKKYILLEIILLMTIFIVVGLYWIVFHDGLSYNSEDWGNLGSYFNGVLSPILTFANIFIFIDISMKLSVLDDKRAEKESEGQKNLILMQFRKKEIDSFEMILNQAHIPSSQFMISKEDLARPIVLADLYLQTFLKSKLSLFNLTANSEIAQSIYELKSELKNYHAKFVSDQKLLITDVLRLLELQSSIINYLQMITMDDTTKN